MTEQGGATTPGTGNANTVVTFFVDGATAVLREPNVDLTTINQRGWFEIQFRA